MALLLTERDTAAAQDVIELTYELVQDTYLAGLVIRDQKTPEVIGISGVCVEMSDAATRAAQQLGIVASREYRAAHCITSFGPLDELPHEDDPILCLTWGQFNFKAFIDNPQAFFGKRKDIAQHVGKYYPDNYGSHSILYRQVTHTPPLKYPILLHCEHYWLKTTPADLQTGTFPIGEVAMSDFSSDLWD